MDTVLVIHGPNLNLLGQREQDIYGNVTLEDINTRLREVGLSHQYDVETVQSNHEGEIVDVIGKTKGRSVSGILMNPAAYTHTSVAIRDAISAVDIPVVEVHLSNIYAREDFRHTSLSAPVCQGQISGFGVESYYLGLQALIHVINGSA